MSNRLGKRLSTFGVALFTGGMLAIAVQSSARAEDTCLVKPGATTPRGGHWHYRVEPGTKRHCWYLGEGKAALETAAKLSSSAPASDKRAMKASAPPLRPSITNAHAELDDATSANDSADANSLPSTRDSSGEPAQNTNISQPTATAQWPDPAINAVPVVNATQPPVQAAVTSGPQTPDPPVSAATIEPATQAVGERSEPSLASAVVNAPEAEIQSHSSSMLLGGLAGALAVAGFLGFAAVRFGNLGSLLQIRHSRLIEDLVDQGYPPPWKRKGPDTAQTSRSDVLRIRQDIEAQSRDIMEILSRASRGATT
ncbi:hypothetical protein [Nitrobacter sp. TKz-YC02]|uniref:hypothetical protein n=1 Tax=Nitrobacter sp. TKz-YC02 TaxID=3398704 RepID=UPI003CE9E162